MTPSLSWSAYDLRKSWNQVKGTVAPWWAENSNAASAGSRWTNAARNLPTLVGEVTGCGGGELRRDSPMETHVRPHHAGNGYCDGKAPRVNARAAGDGCPNKADSHPILHRIR